MKNLILILFIFIYFNSNAQIDNTLYIGWMMEVQKAEDKLLDKIEKNQAQLVYASTAMSVSSVLMANTEQKLHYGLNTVYDIVDHADIILSIYKSSRDILKVQDGILAVCQGNEALMLIGAYYEVEWINKAYQVLIQLLLATKESNFSLMSNFKRLELLHNTAAELKKIKKETNELYVLLSSIKDIMTLEVDDIILEYDFKIPVENIEFEINQLTRL